MALLRHAIDILMNGARALDVSQAATVPVLDGIRTKVDKRSTAYDYETYEVDRAPRAQVRFASLADAAALRPAATMPCCLSMSTGQLPAFAPKRARLPR